MKILKKKKMGGHGREGVRGPGWEGGQGGCVRRIEVFEKIQKKKKSWVSGGGFGFQGGCNRNIGARG